MLNIAVTSLLLESTIVTPNVPELLVSPVIGAALSILSGNELSVAAPEYSVWVLPSTVYVIVTLTVPSVSKSYTLLVILPENVTLYVLDSLPLLTT